MGTWHSRYFGSPETAVDMNNGPRFDDAYGFEEGRQERVMKVTEEEMAAIGLKESERDYCAHHLIDFYDCRRQKFPWIAGCKHVLHEWHNCQNEDRILRMKEYEREGRLLERAKRKGELEQVQQAEVLVR